MVMVTDEWGSCDYASEDSYSSVPDYLSAALERLSSHPYVRQWSPDKSVFKLLYILCLPELYDLLDQIKVASAMSENVEMISLRCVEEGKLVELAALLLFAWDRLGPPADDEGNIESSPIARHIIKESRSQDSDERLHNFGVRWQQNHVTKTMCLTSAGKLLRVLCSFRDVFHDIRECEAKCIPKHDVPYEFAYKIWLNAKSGTNRILKPDDDVYCDDIPCLRPQLNQEDKASLKEALQRQIQKGNSSTTDLPVKISFERLAVNDDGDTEEPPFEHRYDFDHYLRRVTLKDNKADFVKLVKLSKGEEDWIYEIRQMVFDKDLVNCCAAILDGETEGLLTLDGAFSSGAPRWTFLHEAVNNISPRIISLLLERGFAADSNIRSNFSDLKLRQALPLEALLAQSRVCFLSDWTGNKTAVSLIIRLCEGKMGEFLEAVRMLALNTNDLKQIFLKYLIDGKMIEVGALLMVARKQLLSPSDNLSFMSISELRDILLTSYEHTSPIGIRKNTQPEIGETFILLEILEKTGDAITAYIQLEDRLKLSPQQTALEIAAILEDGGFKVTHEDSYMISPSRPLNYYFGRSFLHKEVDKSPIKPSWGKRQDGITIDENQISATGTDPQRFVSFKTMSQSTSVKLPGNRPYGTIWVKEAPRNNHLAVKTTFLATPLSCPLPDAVRKFLPPSKIGRIMRKWR